MPLLPTKLKPDQPTVSGSTGKLVIEHPKTDATETAYPGAVFGNTDLDYVQAITEYVSVSAKAADVSNSLKHEAKTQSQLLRIEKQQLRREAEQLRTKRWSVRQRRAQEDTAWESLRLVRRPQQEKRLALRQANKRPPWGSQTAENQPFKQLCQ